MVKGNLFKTTNLEAGVAYEFRVFAENMAGVGKPSKASEAMFALDPVDPPGQPEPLYVNKNVITIQWTKPEYDGGFKITGYTVEKRDLPAGRWIRANFTNIIETTFMVSGLTQDAAYEFRVFARNSAGSVSLPSDPSDPITCKDDIVEPRIMVDAIFKDVVLLKAGENFKLEADIAGQPIPSMAWTKNGKEIENTMKLDIKFTDLTTTLVNKDSVRADGGEFVLTATNVGGFAKHIFNVKVLDRPGPPGGPLVVSDVTADNCILTWTPPADDGGAKIEAYVIEKRESTRLVWTNVVSDLQFTQFMVTKLLKGNEYIFRVMAVNKYGVGEALDSEPTLADNPYISPDAPQNPEVTAITRDAMFIMWKAPQSDGGSTVTNYNIERKDKIGLRWVKCNKKKVKELQFKATGLVVGHEYEFRIIAENAAGLSAPSVASPFYKATDSLDQPGPPCNPRTLDTTKSSITVAWNKPVYDGGSDITGYIVETCEPSEKEEDEEWTIVTPTEGLLATSFTIINLKENQEYKINISALNSEGIGEAASIPDNVKAEDRLLPPELDLDAELRKVVNLRASKISHYIVERRETSRLVWTVVDQKVENTCLKVKKLLEGNEYIFRVRAVNQFGVGAVLESSAVMIKDPYVPPTSPKSLEISEIMKDSMVLTWEAPSEDGGSPITGYIIEKHDKEGVRWTRCNRKMVTDLTYKITRLMERHSYEFRVLAENAIGVGEPSSPTVFYKALDPIFRPGPPHHPKVTDTTKSSVFLSWAKPMDDGETPEVPPEIAVEDELSTEKAAELWTMCTPATGIKNTKFEVENLKENQAYKLRVCAINKVGVGEHADVSGAIIAEDKIEEPDLDIDPELRKILSIKAGASLRLFIPIRGRPTPTITWNKDEAALKETAQVEVTSSYTSLVIDKMNRYDSGKYTVTAENTSGTKSAFVVVRVLDTPSPPVNLKVKEITNRSVTLAWDSPLLDGGAKIKNYILEKRESTRKTYAAVITNCHELSWKIEPLQEGCSYYFRVLAENAHGVGLPAATVDPLKVSEVPQAPKNLIVTDQTKTSIALAWEKPEYDGGSRVLQYLLEMQVKGQDKWSGVNTFKTMEATVSNLNQGEEYLFRITAMNDKGKSDPKVLASPIAAKDLVYEPDIRPVFSSYSVKVGKDLSVDIPIFGRPKPVVNWSKDGGPLKFTTRVNIINTLKQTTLSIKEAVGDDGGMYSINAANSTGKKDTTVEIIVLDKPGPPSGPEAIEYEYRVSAENIVGIGRCSKISEGCVARDPCDPPGTPEAVHVTKDTIVIQWTKPEYDGGSSITGYTVEKRDLPEGRWIRANFTNVIETKFTISGLTENAQYDFRVIAKNAVGTISKPSYNSGPIIASNEL
uniref:Titin n=1 Tax=Gadus morhua TaxID=8049 RepID=A0A8C5FG90_GADMO